MIKRNKHSLEGSIQDSNINSKSGHSIFSLPIMLGGILVGVSNSIQIGYKLAQGIPIDPIDTTLSQGICLGITSLCGADFCSSKKELLIIPTVYTGIQVIAGAAGYGIGYISK
mgnify:CR=1 FL=1|tara:strand:- start:3150 stop:3488 length:339 start_codon:yes stop_codon:yes gene_type:complete